MTRLICSRPSSFDRQRLCLMRRLATVHRQPTRNPGPRRDGEEALKALAAD